MLRGKNNSALPTVHPINEWIGRGLSPPPVLVIPVPVLTLLAFPGLAWFPGLLVTEGYEFHKLISATALTDWDFAGFGILFLLVEVLVQFSHWQSWNRNGLADYQD
jgi:hypothetical protein